MQKTYVLYIYKFILIIYSFYYWNEQITEDFYASKFHDLLFPWEELKDKSYEQIEAPLYTSSLIYQDFDDRTQKIHAGLLGRMFYDIRELGIYITIIECNL